MTIEAPLGCFCSECHTRAVPAVVDATQLDEAVFRGHVVRPGDADYNRIARSGTALSTSIRQ